MAKCKYCGEWAGLFSNAHKKCIGKYELLANDGASHGTSRIDMCTIEWLPNHKISLSEALRLFVDNFGIYIYADYQLLNSLSDVVDFSECKGAKSVLRELIHNNTLNCIVKDQNSKKYDYYLQIISKKAESDFGFTPQVITYVIDAIKFSLGLVVNEKIADRNSEIEVAQSSSSPSNNSTPIPPQLSHLDFWGLPMGDKKDAFDSLFKSKGYHVSTYNDSKEKKIQYTAYGYTETFIGYGSGITLFESPYTSLVYKIEVYLYKMITKSLVIYNELYPLLIERYGKPYKDDNIQKRGPKTGHGVFFKTPEGMISLTFRDYYLHDFTLYLSYEDTATINAINHELPKYADEMRRKKEKEEQDYKNKLISDL